MPGHYLLYYPQIGIKNISQDGRIEQYKNPVAAGYLTGKSYWTGTDCKSELIFQHFGFIFADCKTS
ncbi:MAG: hypothetical protein A3F83_09525 [Candidatus Glassbacteria bacterium RIFCSPLOWO2_12_FULL_58_11]|uniref:Uncharacterized protein n=2 Tax=Candidatus Glassiibacteriota TaxID=1817805 RepID=A0A1F5YYF6_9BACT|nr:MAG: hypothetical protein A2Z86_06600 [Candidatus Glassbacteria bacterium GWA2_58_10]OGG05165.1 MAG: hypothetical protein A3F83_09525 [Candidatus Glassbacteria bacterium RIFCSPLOWO2_12_FULL_58_11]